MSDTVSPSARATLSRILETALNPLFYRGHDANGKTRQELLLHWQEVQQQFELKERELEAVCIVAAGCTYIRTAQLLNLNEGAIRRHLRNAFKKLGISTRKELARFVIKHNLPVEKGLR